MNHTNIGKGGLFFVANCGGIGNLSFPDKFFSAPKRGQTRVINTAKVITATQLRLHEEANLKVVNTPSIVHEGLTRLKGG